MCGIAGIWNLEAAADQPRVETMLEILAHRGPDGTGVWSERGLTLGHRRLAIIDPTPAGAQPMLRADRYVITYNGEVYNYVELRQQLQALGAEFATQCDTEVLLAAYEQWGRDCLAHLNGMFAFAIYDREERTLFCARDRLGVKPFYYVWNGMRFAFASETKALVATDLVSGELQHDAVYEYLARGYTSCTRSFWAGVEVLPPGHALSLRQGEAPEVWSWWQPTRELDENASFDVWAERIAELIDDSVRLRLRSDVPVGTHLSGGLDSSAITAAAARNASTDIVTFTGAFRDDRRSDEREFSRAVNQMYSLQAHEVEIAVDDLAVHFDRLMWHLDEPIAGPGAFPQLLVCDLANAHGVKVVLGGQGGDELFGGYLRHRALHYSSQLRSGSPRERASAFLELAALASREWRRVRRTSTRVRDEHLDPQFLSQVDPQMREQARRSPMQADSAGDLMWWDLRNYLPALLHVEDRTSMAASLESRTPLLDYRLVETALSIPTRHVFRRGAPKPLLRAATGDWLPAAVRDRTDKRGFPTPLQHWPRRPQLRELVERLTAPGAVERSVFSDEYLRGRDGFAASELWSVMSVQGWLAAYEDGSAARRSSRAA